MLKRLGFTARIFLLSTVLVVLALGVAAFATYTRGSRIAEQAAHASLEHSREVQQNFQTLHFQRLRLMSQLVATDPAFVSYVAEAGGNNPFAQTQPGEGSNSIANLLNERQTEIGFDLGVVLDPSGTPIAQTQQSATLPGNMAANQVVAAAMQSQSPETGYWLRDGKIYQVAVASLGNRDQLAGYLVLGLLVSQAQLQNVKQVSDSDLVMLDETGGKYTSVVATLDPPHLAELEQALAGRTTLPSGVFMLTLGGERWLASAASLDTGGNGIALTLTSLDKAMGGFRDILTAQLAAALFALLLALALSWWLSAQTSKPLRKLAQAAQAAARGDYQRHLPASKTGGEVAELTGAFDSLLSDLREKSEMEIYLADLAKYQPDAAAEHAVPGSNSLNQEAGSLSGAFLAVRLPDAPAASMAMPDKALLAFNALLRNLEIPARQQGGRLAVAAGNRAFLAFDNFKAALVAAGQILGITNAEGQKPGAALALGKVITGPAEWTTGGGTSLLGAPIRELEELLPDAPPGTLVATSELATRAQGLLGADIKTVTGSFSGRALSALTLPEAPEGDVHIGDTLIDTRLFTPGGNTPGGNPLDPRPKFVPGMVLGGRYEILAELGAGGMARVYKARDRQLNEVVALKTLKYASAQDQRLLDGMKNEIRLLHKLTHRNVLRIYDFNEADGVPFISMEYVRGMTLKYMLENRARLPYAPGLRVLRQICAALQVAHAEGILHLDIKPANVMLEPGGNVKLMDFGIAAPLRHGNGQAPGAAILGTPRYASPEQLQGKPLDERTDIYACGAMMYQMFTGKLAFDQRQLNEMLAYKIKERYKAPETLVQDFPPALAGVLAACLKAAPEERPESATALLHILEGLRV